MKMIKSNKAQGKKDYHNIISHFRVVPGRSRSRKVANDSESSRSSQGAEHCLRQGHQLVVEDRRERDAEASAIGLRDRDLEEFRSAFATTTWRATRTPALSTSTTTRPSGYSVRASGRAISPTRTEARSREKQGWQRRPPSTRVRPPPGSSPG